MSKKTILAAFCFLLCFAVAAQAAEMKIAVFNFEEVAEKSVVLKEAKAAMDKAFSPEKANLEKQRADLEKRSSSLKNATEAQIAELQKAQQNYADKAGAYLRKIQTAETEVRDQINATITQAARDYAKKNGYNLILDSQSAPYFDDSFNVTSDMIGEANRVWREAKK